MILALVNEFVKHEKTILNILALIMVIVGMVFYFILLFKPAAYGRYSKTDRFYSIAVSARLAWFLQELPAFTIPVISIVVSQLNLMGAPSYSNWQLAVLSCFIIHYFNR